AAGQFSFDVGDDAVVWSGHEADHLIDRFERAAKRAMPLHPGSGFRRAAIELIVLFARLCARQHRRCRSPYAPVAGASAGAASASGAGGGASSASVTQPALMRACMIKASASSRDTSRPSKKPASCLLSPSLRSVQPV